MLSKCANPECTAPFHYLREGKLFQIDSRAFAEPERAAEKKPVQRIEYFWLCGSCAEKMTLGLDRGKGVITVPLSSTASPFLRRAAVGA
jgi:hypothetical protein